MRLSLLIVLIAAALMIPFAATAAGVSDLAGTWSGDWTPKGGVLDAVTVEIHQENGKLTGKFRTPVSMDFTNASFNSKTGAIVLEAMDSKSGTHYKIDAKLNGTEMKGTLDAGDKTGDLLLIKWTYIPR